MLKLEARVVLASGREGSMQGRAGEGGLELRHRCAASQREGYNTVSRKQGCDKIGTNE